MDFVRSGMLNLLLQDQTPVPAVPRAPVAPPSPRASQAEYNVLKAREKELKSQLEDVQDRRNELSQKADEASGADKAGIQGRIGVLDGRLSNIENDLELVGRQLVATAPASMGVPAPRIIYQGFNEDDMMAAGFSGAGIMLALLLPFLIRGWRRGRRALAAATSHPPLIGGERIDRMEQAIDSIAIEIERVSENQRFMTRLMTETQLAGTIAAVRGSAEAAKAAAEGSGNGS
jgi:FtsZ-binding cell division protein ZapB